MSGGGQALGVFFFSLPLLFFSFQPCHLAVLAAEDVTQVLIE